MDLPDYHKVALIRRHIENFWQLLHGAAVDSSGNSAVVDECFVVGIFFNSTVVIHDKEDVELVTSLGGLVKATPYCGVSQETAKLVRYYPIDTSPSVAAQWDRVISMINNNS
jgi:hypothetical protein